MPRQGRKRQNNNQRPRRRRAGRGRGRGAARMGSNVGFSQRQGLPGMPISIPRMSAFNFRHRCTLRYVDTVSLGIYGVSPAGYVFSANGCYDPDITGTGHQPLGFDQLMVFFNHYTVLRSRIKVTWFNSANNDPATGAIAVQRSSSVLSSFQRVLECGDAVYAPIGGVMGAGGPLAASLKHGVDVANFQSIPNVLNDDTLRGTAAANPSAPIFYVLYVKGLSTSDVAIAADVQIDYDVMFTEPLQPAQSLEIKAPDPGLWAKGLPRIPRRLLPSSPSGIPSSQPVEPDLEEMFSEVNLHSDLEGKDLSLGLPPTPAFSATGAGGSCSSS